MPERKNEAFLILEEDGRNVRYDLGPEAKYTVGWSGHDDLVRVWDDEQTHVTTLQRLVHLCLPNARS